VGVPSTRCSTGASLTATRGFTYVGLLIFLAILALASAATLTTGHLMQRRAAEEELLFVGGQFAAAFRSYANATPAGQRAVPATLEDLLRDPRYPGVRRHLRRLYVDPVTGRAQWGLVAAPGGGIMGVHSLSEAAPIKVAEFDPPFAVLAGRTAYKEWLFGYAPPGLAPAGTVSLAGVPAAPVTKPEAGQKPAPQGGTAAADSPGTPDAPAAKPSAAVQPSTAAAPAADPGAPVELTFSVPPRVRVGGIVSVRVAFPPTSGVRTAEVTVEFDPRMLQPVVGGGAGDGRVVLQLRSNQPSRAPLPAFVRLRVIGDAPRTTDVGVSAAAFDAEGNPVTILLPSPRAVEVGP